MSFAAEAQIAREIMKFAANGLLYRGSKPVMWSMVEKTALAEAEVEYEDHISDTVWVKFPVKAAVGRLANASVLIWTTTPWTLPGNRAISFSSKIAYGFYKVTDASADNWAKTGDLLILADKLAPDVFKQARVTAHERTSDIDSSILDALECSHPLKGLDGGYEFTVPLFDGDQSPMTPAQALSIPRRATAARTSTSGRRMRAAWKRVASHRLFPTPSMPTAR
jgi:isoleucyl-tRNA synthetase